MLRFAALTMAVVFAPLSWGSPVQAAPDHLDQPASVWPRFQTEAPAPMFLGEITGGAAPLDKPAGMALAADGTLYVVDANHDQIRVFTATGEPLATWGESGADPGQFLFRYPDGSYAWGDLALGPDDALYVLDPSNSRVQVFSTDGAFVREWGDLGSEVGQLSLPSGIAVDREGTVYVADQANRRVQLFDSAGQVLAVWDGTTGGGEPLAAPADVAIAPDGTVWVTDAMLHRVIAFAPDGTVLTSFGQIGGEPGELRGPLGIAVDSEGTLYVAEYDNNRIQIFAPDGTSLGILGDRGEGAGQFVHPNYLMTDPTGVLSVADEGNDRIQQFRLGSEAASPGTPVS